MVLVLLACSLRAGAAPYAALVMDARSGEVIHSKNADTRLHPASLTKMMTLYIAFEAIEKGEIGLDTKVTISKHAASEPPSKLGLRAGSRIEMRYLIRAAAVKSANDAATAIGEAISGSEAAFAKRMNRTAKALGMNSTTFKNAHGLTQSGHLSTARDMTVLGRHLLYGYPDYYNLFSRISTNAKLAQVSNTNRRFLGAYKGADGIKTGYTRAAGFNLVASAERGRERIIATMFGGTSTAQRNAKVAELLDIGFRKARPNVRLRKPRAPAYVGEVAPAAGKTIRVIRAVSKSPRPMARPRPQAPMLLSDATSQTPVPSKEIDAAVAAAVAAVTAPPATSAAPAVVPVPRMRRVDYAGATRPAAQPEVEPIVVSRVSTSGNRHWGITIGKYGSRFAAERVLLQTALAEMSTLDGALRKVAQRSGGYQANFVGMSEDQADLACRRLTARGQSCSTIGPG